eukprot:EG_transcript_5187
MADVVDVSCVSAGSGQWYGFDVHYESLRLQYVDPTAPAYEALQGFLGARIVAVDGQAVDSFPQLQTRVLGRRSVVLGLQRDGSASPAPPQEEASAAASSLSADVCHPLYGKGKVVKQSNDAAHVQVQFADRRRWVPRRDVELSHPADRAVPLAAAAAPSSSSASSASRPSAGRSPMQTKVAALVTSLQQLGLGTGGYTATYAALRDQPALAAVPLDELPAVLRQAKKDALVEFPGDHLVIGRDDTVLIALATPPRGGRQGLSLSQRTRPRATWRELRGDGYVTALSHHRAVLHRHRLLVLGGRKQGSLRPSTDLFQFDLQARVWSKVPAVWPAEGPARPSPSWEGYSAALVQDRVYMTGRGPVVWALDLAADPPCWTPHEAQGLPSCDRIDHTAVAQGNSLFLFGGVPGDGRAEFFSNVLRFDIDSGQWSEEATTGDLPLGRVGHAAVLSADQECLVVTGGAQFAQAGEPERPLREPLAVLHLPRRQWHRIAVSGTPLPCLVNHSAAVTRRNEMLLCGLAHLQWPKLYLVHLNTYVCTEVLTDTPPLNSRALHTSVMYGNTLLRFGGDGTTAVHCCVLDHEAYQQCRALALANVRRVAEGHAAALPWELTRHVMVWLGTVPYTAL